MRELLILATLLLAAACSQQLESERVAQTDGCLISLVFDTEEARTSFLRSNAGVIANIASTGEALLTSDASLPEIKIFTPDQCAGFDSSRLGLDIPEHALASTDDMTQTEAGQVIGALHQGSVFTSSTPRACVLRIAPPPSQSSGQVMSALAVGGLRGSFVTGNEHALFAAYDEPCPLVRSHVDAIAELFGVDWPPAIFCANVGLNQCGFEGAIGFE